MIDVTFVELRLKIVELSGVRLLTHLRDFVVGLERLENLLRFVHEVEHKRIFLAGAGAVQPGKRLHGLNTRQPLVYQLWHGLNRLLEPIYSPIRRILPKTGGLDLAPLVALIGVYAVRIILINNAAKFY